MSQPPEASSALTFDLNAITFDLNAVTFYLNAVGLQLPEFWADNARVWFAQTEAQFAVRGVTSSLTKF